jgi:hypothetical protein
MARSCSSDQRNCFR